VTILDAYAVVAFLRAEPAAAQVSSLLDGDSATLTAVGLAEVIDHMLRLADADEETLLLDLAQLGLLEAVPVDPALGASAGRLRARSYHRTRCAVSMADCLAAETARTTGQPLATADPHLLDVCHTERIATLVLPDTASNIWSPPN
jgi:PIN domain nuclease of toxin-antitoxin system